VLRLQQEEQHARLPIVVRRHLVVEPEYLRPATQERRTVRKVRETGVQDRPDELLVELSAQFEAGNEGSHEATSSTPRWGLSNILAERLP
jgi:hypothetical protein